MSGFSFFIESIKCLKFSISFSFEKVFLPKQLNDEDTKKICEEIISKLGANSIKDMGKVMGELKKQHADEIDFSKAGTFIKNLLNK